jgi:hypothetical protein
MSHDHWHGGEGHQSVHERADDIQGEASSEDHQGSPRKGRQRRYLIASKMTIQSDGCVGSADHAPTGRIVC